MTSRNLIDRRLALSVHTDANVVLSVHEEGEVESQDVTQISKFDIIGKNHVAVRPFIHTLVFAGQN